MMLDGCWMDGFFLDGCRFDMKFFGQVLCLNTIKCLLYSWLMPFMVCVPDLYR